MKICLKILLACCLFINFIACSSLKDENADNKKIDYVKASLLNVELGQSYLAQGQVSRAKGKLVHALELAPNLPEANAAIAYFQETVGDYAAADKYYKKAISFSKDKGEFYNSYGTFLCKIGKYKEAENAFLNAIKDVKYTRTAEVYENAGLCSLRAAELDKAEHYFTLAVRYDAKQINSLMELSELLFNKGEVKQAKYFLKQLKTQTEPSPRSLWLAIQIARKEKDKDAVASNALQLKSLFANSAEYKLYLESK